MKNLLPIMLVVAIVAIVLFRLNMPAGQAQITNIKIPQLTALQSHGQILFEKNCAACHGRNAAGTKSGPPFIHKIYEPNHHADGAFYSAVKNGVRAHHWPYGNMAPVTGIGDGEVKLIINYVRALQKTNGIF